MATETSERRSHIRSIGVTSAAALAGVAAAVVSSMLTAGADPGAAAHDQQAQLVVLAAIALQIPVYRFLGIYDEDEFGAKVILFIAFMTFSLWFIAWGIMLTTGVAF